MEAGSLCNTWCTHQFHLVRNEPDGNIARLLRGWVTEVDNTEWLDIRPMKHRGIQSRSRSAVRKKKPRLVLPKTNLPGKTLEMCSN